MGAEDTDMPKTLSNIIVSIHAIATFQALHDYLRPRVAGLMAGGSRLSNMLAALASSGLAPGSSAGFTGDIPRPPTDESASSASVTRRRSQRLSAKKSGQLKDTDSAADAQIAQGSEPGQSASSASNVLESPDAAAGESPPSDTVVNEDDFAAEFTDDEVDPDAEVIDDEGDQEMPDKTVTVSVGDG